MKWNTVLALGLILALVTVARAAPDPAPLALGGAPSLVSYQGEVRVGGSPYTGLGHFKFAVVDGSGNSTWSNDGTSASGGPPASGVPLVVSEGLFGVLLGDTSLPGMTQALTAGAFEGTERSLRVWFSSDGTTYSQLSPDTRVASAPYALQAQRVPWSGVTGAPSFQREIAQVVIVAKNGGDYTSVQAAIDSIADASAAVPYLVWVAPGVYEGTVTMKPHVHVQGAGQEATRIASTASGAGALPSQATLALASDTSLRDLTVVNGTSKDNGAALIGEEGTTGAVVAGVTVVAQGGGTENYAIVVTGSGTSVTLRDVTALAENASDYNYGLYVSIGASATVHGGAYTGRGGTSSRGIYALAATLEATGAEALSENGSQANAGLLLVGGSATLRGGSYTARGGSDARGLYNSAGTLRAEGVTARGEDASGAGYGLYNRAGTATLIGGSMTARDAVTDTCGILNETTTASSASGASGAPPEAADSDPRILGAASIAPAVLEAHGTAALGESAAGDTYGLWNRGGGTAELHGGSYTARGGTAGAHGIANQGAGTILDAYGVTVLGEGSSNDNYGLANWYGSAAAELRASSFTGRGGWGAYGIYTLNCGRLFAAGIVALGEGGSSLNRGLSADVDQPLEITQSTLQGTVAVYHDVGSSSTVRVSLSRLVGTVTAGDPVTCVAVTDGTTFYSTGCP